MLPISTQRLAHKEENIIPLMKSGGSSHQTGVYVAVVCQRLTQGTIGKTLCTPWSKKLLTEQTSHTHEIRAYVSCRLTWTR